jgi:2-polyprenyl-3-methyl-5-hydroxy-6-metoxy-1,4-benzoquinol methylase
MTNASNYEAPKPIVWDDQTVKRFWAYQSQFPQDAFSYQQGASVVRHSRKFLKPGARVLDYGCGAGHLLAHLARVGFSVTGADLASDTMGNTLSQRHVGGVEKITVLDHLMSESELFDAVFLLEVIEHLDDRWLDQTMTNIHRLLKQNGALIVTTPNDEKLEDNIVYCPVSNIVFHRWQHVRKWDAETLERALLDRGFSNVHVETRTFYDIRNDGLSPPRQMIARIAARLRKPTSLFAVARV